MYEMDPIFTRCVRITRDEIAPYMDLDAENAEWEAYQASRRSLNN